MKQALEITTVIGCKNMCTFCPQKQLVAVNAESKRVFDPDDFDKCLSTVPAEVRIVFSGFSEPFFNKNAAFMLYHAACMGHEVQLFTTCMGIRGSDLYYLQGSTPSYVCIHVPDTKALVIPDDEWIAEHDTFLEADLTTTKPTYMTMGELTPAVKFYLDEQGIEVNQPTMISRAGTLWDREPLHGHIECSDERYHENVLIPDGTVVGCCMDYELKVKLGNLLTQPYGEIWDAAERWRLRNHNHDICAKCEWGYVKV